jgi:serine protease Do
MIHKSFAFMLFVLFGVGAAFAQTPEPKADKQGAVKAMAWSFDSDGGYLGVQTEDVNRENLSKYSLRDVKGVGVESVAEGSPAQKAGLQKGDVIFRVNGEEITSTRKLSRLINEISPDHQARLTVLRGGSEREITVTVGKRPGIKFGDGLNFELFGPQGRFEIPMPQMPDMPNLDRLPRVDLMVPPGAPDAPMAPFAFGGTRRQIGVGLTPLTKQLADHYGVEGGALVNNVRENSPAAKAGIKAGDIIVEADGKAIKGDLDLVRTMTEKREGSINLTVVRDRSRQNIQVTPEEVKGMFNNFFEFNGPEGSGAIRMERPAAPGAPAIKGFVFAGPII